MTRPRSSRIVSWSETREISCRNAGERRLLGLLSVLPRDADELLEVLDPPARLDRALGLEGVERARLLQHALEELVDVQLLRERHERLHRRVEAADRAARRGGHAGCLGIGHRLEERAAGVLRVCDEALQRRVADPTSRAVRDAQERGRVLRVHENGEIRRRVADLGAFVEARPADHLVRHVLPHEHVLEHPRLRVHPVEDRDLARRVAAADERRDLGGDEPRLRVLVLHLDRAHRVALAELGEEPLRLALGVLLDQRRSRRGGSCSSSGSSARA